MYKYIVFLLFIILLLYWLYWALRCHNPWKFYLYTGKKGSGKSTIETMWILHYANTKILCYDENRPRFHRFFRKKLKIYSNSPINSIETEYFDPRELGISFFPDEYSVLFCDEISLYWWNRNFKSMNEKTVEWFRNQRKHKCIVYGFTQSWDIDKVLRKSLVDYVFLVKNVLITFALVRKVEKYQDIKENALDGDSQFSESMKFASPLAPGALKFVWLPKYFKYYDTNYIFKKEG